MIKTKECLRIIQNLFAEPEYTELVIGTKAYIKLMCYCHLAGEQEITGLGRIIDNTIVDFKIPYQEVTGTTAQASDGDMINLMREIPIDEMKQWKLDWHSHVDMEAFISPTDEANYELMSMARGGKQFPLLVVNKKGDFCAKQFIHEGKCPNIKIILREEKITNAMVEKIYNQCKEEVSERLSMKVIKKKVYGKTRKIGTIYGEDYGTCCSCGRVLRTQAEFENGLCDECLQAWYAGEKW